MNNFLFLNSQDLGKLILRIAFMLVFMYFGTLFQVKDLPNEVFNPLVIITE